MFDNYIWDFDGTLFDTYGVMSASLFEIVKQYQLPLTFDQMYQWIKTESVRDLAAHFLPMDERLSFLAAYHYLEAKRQVAPQPFPQASAVIKQIASQGKRQFILTHRDKKTIEFLRALDLLQYFEEVITSDYQFKRKPNPEAIQYLIDKYHLSPEQTVMIGDRALDITSGQLARVKTILYDIDFFLEGIEADYVVHDLKSILKIE
ncbi:MULTISPECIES: HAD-IA family hydrolase [unclassified Enterococcus]|uniref:HAD-IA family hydrolase n=1 Tax=unclassified Enterococcus TaxID=2608891 RepID=UPI001552D008|nr:MULTISPECIES: HAD-IA family hydrolase [unclassified Enterococcus]MBS7577315.1 HAD-IA family hydrolase [Enterococcus sp. MMGLQ5-2]MBS7584592.1 HAD-IA family hydrolase [Enterococcus sp. MMGLQ5-1]NPD12447.1 HAD-IA family hydrolase [Enterococcus sp. MMGLQ5-1]NPD37149.1 HAD-IA family hydrolase [Enterococcus sp. MMGLQ5-2]